MPEGSNERDLLLYVLAARRVLSWDQFRDIYDTLCEGDGFEVSSALRGSLARWRTARIIDSLCHADITTGPDGAAYVSPSVFARLPLGGTPQAVLVGARTRATISQLQSRADQFACTVECEQQESSLRLAPNRVTIRAEDDEMLARFAREVGSQYLQEPPAWQLACLASHAVDVGSSSAWRQDGVEPNWNQRTFDPDQLRFDRASQNGYHSRLVKYVHPKTMETQFWLWRGNQYRKIDPDWGRYLVLRDLDRRVILRDQRSLSLAVPTFVPLPRILSRAATICSGYAPAFMSGSQLDCPDDIGYDVYRWVPPRIADMISTKLQQDPVSRSIPQPRAAQR